MDNGRKIADNFTVSEHLSIMTGLSEETCQELLNKRWTYVELLDEIPRWEAPGASVRNHTVTVRFGG